jgi:hypothetical protein
MRRGLAPLFAALLAFAPASAQVSAPSSPLASVISTPLVQPVIITNITAAASGTASQFAYAAPSSNIAALTISTFIMPVANSGVIGNLVLGSPGSATTGNITATLLKNGVATPLTCTIAITGATEAQCPLNKTAAIVAIGDQIVWKFTTTQSSWASINLRLAYTFTATNGQNGNLWMTSGGNVGTGTTPFYLGVGLSGGNATETTITAIAPSGFWVTSFSVFQTTADSSSNFHNYYLCHNSAAGACQTSPLTCNTSGTSSAGNVSTTTTCVASGSPVYIAPTDTLSIEVVGNNGSVTAKTVDMAVGIQAAIPGQAPIFMLASNMQGNVNLFWGLSGGPNSVTTETTAWSMTPGLQMVYSNLYMYNQTSHTAAKSKTFELRAASSPFPTATTAVTTLKCLNGSPGQVAAVAGGGNGFNAGGGNLTGILCGDLSHTVTMPAAAYGSFQTSVVTTDTNSPWKASYVASPK